jgi:hypothetical protein
MSMVICAASAVSISLRSKAVEAYILASEDLGNAMATNKHPNQALPLLLWLKE